MTSAEARDLRHRDLLEERYGPLHALEAERHGTTPAARRRARRALEAAVRLAGQNKERGTTRT